MKSIHTCSR